MQYGAGDVLEAGQIQALSRSETSSAKVSTLPPLVLLADRQPRVLDFILFIAVFYFCHFSLTLERIFRDSSLMQDKLISKRTDQLWWAASAD